MAQSRVCGEGERSCASLSWGVWDEETAPTCDGTTRTVAVTSGLADVQQGQCEIKGKAQELELPPPRPSHLWPQIRVELQEQLLYLGGIQPFWGCSRCDSAASKNRKIKFQLFVLFCVLFPPCTILNEKWTTPPVSKHRKIPARTGGG